MTAHRIWEGSACFTTHVVRNHTPIFNLSVYSDVICSSLNYCRRERALWIRGYVIMPDHLHLLTSLPNDSPAQLQDVLSCFRRYTATRLAEMLRLDRRTWAIERIATGPRNIALWEDRYRPIDASRGDIYDQKLDYIHMNPVRTGFVREAQHWRFSSAQFYYEGVLGPVTIDPL